MPNSQSNNTVRMVLGADGWVAEPETKQEAEADAADFAWLNALVPKDDSASTNTESHHGEEIYQEGYRACLSGTAQEENPHDSLDAEFWNDG